MTEDPPLEVVAGAHEAACYRAGVAVGSGSGMPAESGSLPGERA
ncbi:MAG TPA: hypothetical protein VNW50_02805 [Streptosporangiaceae bacterium]|nr:hypothetical protein [Streptosporangiaceae bacterium]